MILRIKSLPVTLTLAAAVAMSGCGGDRPANREGPREDAGKPAAGHGHHHDAEGPHHGHLIDLGGGAWHAELVENEQDGTLTVYVLDAAAKKQVPIDATEIRINLTEAGTPRQVTLAASPDETDPAGWSSRFVVRDKELLGQLHPNDADPRLVLKIAGNPYNARLEHDHKNGHAQGHHHHGDDALIWRRENVERNGFRISLGHHGKESRAGEPVEPAVMITRNGKPVSDAQVFNALLSADGRRVLAKEAGTVYEPPTEEEPAHYAQGELTVPQTVDRVVIRYRIVFPGGAEDSFDVTVPVER